MANSWLRLWHDMPNDPKWRVIARVSSQPLHLVIALYVVLLVDASKSMSRGVTNCHDEDLAVTLDCDIGQIEAIKLAMQGRVLEGNYLSGWEKRQPKREDSGNEESGAKSSAERKRLQREREKSALEPEAVTQCHDASRNVTTDKDKDKDKDKELNTLSGKPDDAPKNPKQKKPTQEAQEVLSYLNGVVGSSFQPVPANIDLIVARLRDGTTVEKLKGVIDRKFREWETSSEMRKYLRPATLFNAIKCAQYVGEAESVKTDERRFVC